MNRRESLTRMAAGMFALAFGSRQLMASVPPSKPLMTVYKSPSCGCCGAWVKHVKANGFDVKEINVDDVTPHKRKYGITDDLSSCHTGIVGAYAFEGHVPADLIKRFLSNPPKDARGLAAPGMPVGSPGMEVGNQKDAYDVVLFKRDGSRSVYARR
jgi:hypothetical protein